MKQGRLKNEADTLVRIACGWRIIEDLDRFVQLQAGRIEFDVLAGAASLDGRALDGLCMTEELASWLHCDAERKNLPVGYITSALLSLDFAAHVDAEKDMVWFERRAQVTIKTSDGDFGASFAKEVEPPYRLRSA